MTTLDRWIPAEAENAVIGAILSNPDSVIDAARITKPSDFGLSANQWVADAVWQCLAERLAPTRQVVISKLRLAGRWGEGISTDRVCNADLDQFQKNSIEGDSLTTACLIIRENATRRRANTTLLKAAQTVLASEVEYTELQAVVMREVGGLFENVNERDASIDGIGLARLTQVDSGERIGIKTGINWLDILSGGLQPSETWVIGAPYKGRKTTLALNITLTVAHQGMGVTLLTAGDSSREATWDKLLALQMNMDMLGIEDYRNLLPVSSQGLRHPIRIAELHQLRNESAIKLRALPIRIRDGVDLVSNLEIAEQHIRRDVAMFGTGLFVYDYAQAADCGRDDYEVGVRFSKWNQRVIGELGISSIVLSQESEESIKAKSDSLSPGAKGGGALPAMANYYLKLRYTEPNISIELKLARDARQGDKYIHRVIPASGLLIDREGTKSYE